MSSDAPAPGAVLLPGVGAATRAALGVHGPEDVPRWATDGGAAVRRAAGAVSADAGTVRRAGDTLRTLVSDVASALGWRGGAAEAAQGDIRAVLGQLTSVASQLDRAGAALASFAAALDAQQRAVAPARGAWDRAGAPERVALLRQWQPAVSALDVADARTAGSLHDVAAALARARDGVRRARAAPSGAGASRGAPPVLVRRAGDLCRDVVDGLASLANAAGRHPESVAQLGAGLFLTQLGATGEAAGFALDATGIGAAVGVPAGVVSASVLATGLGLAGTAAGRLGAHAAGDDHVMLMGSAREPAPGSAQPVDISEAGFAQRTARNLFSDRGRLAGRTIDDVATALRDGRLGPEDVPVDVVRRDGRVLLLNTRTSLALQRAGIERSRWHVVDRTGQAGYERRLTNQLRLNQLDADGTTSVRITGGKAR